MAQQTIFELHTFRGGHWKVDSIFDDRALALSEAARIESSGRFPAIRVVQENYDRYANEFRTKVIYRTSRLRDDARRAASPSGTTTRKAGARYGDDVIEEDDTDDPLMLLLTFGAIVMVGIAIVLGIRYLAETL